VYWERDGRRTRKGYEFRLVHLDKHRFSVSEHIEGDVRSDLVVVPAKSNCYLKIPRPNTGKGENGM
jgi:hypothetical protein